ncbi:MAG: DAK2 domain-containing protein [Lachnospiraceae bacterium]
MAITTIDAKTLQKMFLAGAKNLEANKEWINELNVFPVPDGDTGTNMTLTILSAAKEVSAIENPDMQSLAKAISSGSLRGARGNSGVILSQLFRGFTKEIANHDIIDAEVLAAATTRAVDTAYKAVMKPKEGTILTVAKGACEKATEMAAETDDLEEIISKTIEHAEYVLSQTPEMLPVLKQAGVVDSGGQGLVVVLKGAFDAFLGKEVDFEITPASTAAPVGEVSVDEADIKFGYCTEFIVMLEKEFSAKDEQEFKAYLESIGDSIVCVADDEIVKIHVHTNDPGLAIQKGLSYGSLTRMKIDNMREEHHERVIKEAERKAATQKEEEAKKPAEPAKEFGFISVSAGSGLSEIFMGLGADYIIEGGQTMNPSTEDMLKAIDEVNAKNIFILPNNSNIILAATQAASIVEDKNIIVVPTKTVPQGISAMISFEMNKTADENLEDMKEAIANVKTGQVTYAVRDTVIDDKEIKQNDIMGIGDKTILSVGQEIKDTTLDLVSQLVDEDSELISIYYGSDVSKEDAEELLSAIEESYPDVEVSLEIGGQPIYYYILSVE